MPFAFVSDNLSFPFQSQGLINLVLNWKFCLSTRFHRTQLSEHPKTKAMAASASSAGHSTFENVAFLADSLPRQKGQKIQKEASHYIPLKPPLSGINSDHKGRVPSRFTLPQRTYIFMPPGGSNFSTGILKGHIRSNNSTLSSQSLCSCGQLGRR